MDGYSFTFSPANADTADVELSGNRRRERIFFETDRHTVVGDVTLPSEGYQARFSDAINREEVAFLPLVDVEIMPLGGGEMERRDFVMLAKAHIRLAYPVAGDSR